ncbi:MAG: hypothetical protein C0595_04020 [Marinilabiliales bacterium]|nr:MAG: hypothetical protein C0595_04020 [Marinilabiliales bacterium]
MKHFIGKKNIKMKNYLKLIRWPNALIIVLSMYFMLTFVINPLLGMTAFSDGLSVTEFVLLVIATLFIAIGGNIVNDISDINPDSVNKPGRNPVGRGISVAKSWTLYYALTILGVIAGSLVSYFVDQINYSLIFLFTVGLLWFYSKKYKCQPLVGNFVVAFLSAISFGLVWLYQFFALVPETEVFTSVQSNFQIVNRMVLIYMGFAFFVSLMREIAKDMEDFKGDDRFGCRTFAVVYGIKKTKILLYIVSLIGFVGLFLVQYYFFLLQFNIHFWFFFLIDLFFVLIFVRTMKANNKEDFSKISLLIKIIMLLGIVSMIFFWFYRL